MPWMNVPGHSGPSFSARGTRSMRCSIQLKSSLNLLSSRRVCLTTQALQAILGRHREFPGGGRCCASLGPGTVRGRDRLAVRDQLAGRVQNLAVLLKAGLIAERREANRRFYRGEAAGARCRCAPGGRRDVGPGTSAPPAGRCASDDRARARPLPSSVRVRLSPPPEEVFPLFVEPAATYGGRACGPSSTHDRAASSVLDDDIYRVASGESRRGAATHTLRVHLGMRKNDALGVPPARTTVELILERTATTPSWSCAYRIADGASAALHEEG